MMNNLSLPIIYVRDDKPFEYKRLDSDTAPTEETLNELGKDDWLLLCIVPSGKKFVAYFRR